MTKPEPSEDTLRSDGDRPPLRLKKSSKNSSNGEPFGTCGSGTPSGPLTVWLVEMLTTASISFSATGATLVGPAHLRAGRRQHQQQRHAGEAARADASGCRRRGAAHGVDASGRLAATGPLMANVS